ncbi:hypothetical protein TIFTF001_008884 [Ficus carica]|uniref:Uncharacterized protein n=1 Tax=Ficus carica TaxID=3494 RepID=A0AA88AFX0_FICCA|nr:hypothetical protein TIFTF001_008884 [Ficus carica]
MGFATKNLLVLYQTDQKKTERKRNDLRSGDPERERVPGSPGPHPSQRSTDPRGWVAGWWVMNHSYGHTPWNSGPIKRGHGAVVACPRMIVDGGLRQACDGDRLESRSPQRGRMSKRSRTSCVRLSSIGTAIPIGFARDRIAP